MHQRIICRSSINHTKPFWHQEFHRFYVALLGSPLTWIHLEVRLSETETSCSPDSRSLCPAGSLSRGWPLLAVEQKCPSCEPSTVPNKKFVIGVYMYSISVYVPSQNMTLFLTSTRTLSFIDLWNTERWGYADMQHGYFWSTIDRIAWQKVKTWLFL